MTLPRFVLGHNSLIGVDHTQRGKGGVKARLSREDRAFLSKAAGLGVGAFLLDNHPVALDAANHLHERHPGTLVIPMVPYAQAVVDGASSRGLGGLAREIAIRGARRGLAPAARSAMAFASGRTTEAGAHVAVAHYLADFQGPAPPVCFLHNAVTDLMLGWDNRDGLAGFAAACRKRGSLPGFVTLNPGFIPEIADVVGQESWFMCAVNSKGIQMSPSQELAEEVLADPRYRVMAMSVLGGGLLDPAIEIPRAYGFPAVRSIVLGTSKVHHLEQALDIVAACTARGASL